MTVGLLNVSKEYVKFSKFSRPSEIKDWFISRGITKYLYTLYTQDLNAGYQIIKYGASAKNSEPGDYLYRLIGHCPLWNYYQLKGPSGKEFHSISQSYKAYYNSPLDYSMIEADIYDFTDYDFNNNPSEKVLENFKYEFLNDYYKIHKTYPIGNKSKYNPYKGKVKSAYDAFFIKPQEQQSLHRHISVNIRVS